jgi:hypothetical protein
MSLSTVLKVKSGIFVNKSLFQIERRTINSTLARHPIPSSCGPRKFAINIQKYEKLSHCRAFRQCLLGKTIEGDTESLLVRSTRCVSRSRMLFVFEMIVNSSVRNSGSIGSQGISLVAADTRFLVVNAN